MLQLLGRILNRVVTKNFLSVIVGHPVQICDLDKMLRYSSFIKSLVKSFLHGVCFDLSLSIHHRLVSSLQPWKYVQ